MCALIDGRCKENAKASEGISTGFRVLYIRISFKRVFNAVFDGEYSRRIFFIIFFEKYFFGKKN